MSTNTRHTKIIREHYEQLYANPLDNAEEMDKFLETYHLPRLNQEATDNWNRLITSSEIEFVIKTKPFSKQKYRTGQLHRGILPYMYRRANSYLS